MVGAREDDPVEQAVLRLQREAAAAKYHGLLPMHAASLTQRSQRLRSRTVAAALTVCLAGVVVTGGAVTAHGATNHSSPSAIAKRLTLRELAGQRVIYSYAGLQPPASLLKLIKAGEAAGVIFFGSNITSGPQLRATTDELQQAAEQSPVHAPLLMMLDQEGGS